MSCKKAWSSEKSQKYLKKMKRTYKWITAPFVKKIFQSINPSGNYLIVDIETGPGFLSLEMGRLFPDAKIIGIDPSNEMLDLSEENVHLSGLKTFEGRLGSPEKIPLASSSADLVVTQSFLHEWKDPEKAFSEIFRVLKPGGKLIIRGVNKNYPNWKLRLQNIFRFITRGGQSVKDPLNSYKNTLSFEETEDLLKRAGFSDIKREEGGYDLFIQVSKGEKGKSMETDEIKNFLEK